MRGSLMSDVAVADREMEALVSLLETEEGGAIAMLQEQMRSFPESRVRLLAGLASAISPALRHIDLVLAERQAPRMRAAFRHWIRNGALLEHGALLVACTGYPRMDETDPPRQLDQLAHQIRPHLPSGDGVKRLKMLCHLMHQVY